MLEESIVANGCEMPILVWNDTIVDGHNRYDICHEHGIPFAKRDKRGKQFCSDRCRYQWWHLHRGESINATAHTCSLCGRVFKTNRQQKYCCHNCYIMARFGGQRRYEIDKGTV